LQRSQSFTFLPADFRVIGKEHGIAKVCPKNVVGPDDMLLVWSCMVDYEGGLLMFEPL
jgi:hypothetical protein